MVTLIEPTAAAVSGGGVPVVPVLDATSRSPPVAERRAEAAAEAGGLMAADTTQSRPPPQEAPAVVLVFVCQVCEFPLFAAPSVIAPRYEGRCLGDAVYAYDFDVFCSAPDPPSSEPLPTATTPAASPPPTLAALATITGAIATSDAEPAFPRAATAAAGQPRCIPPLDALPPAVSCYSATNPTQKRFDVVRVAHRDREADACGVQYQCSRPTAFHADYSWFGGCCWSMASCASCAEHIGWSFLEQDRVDDWMRRWQQYVAAVEAARREFSKRDEELRSVAQRRTEADTLHRRQGRKHTRTVAASASTEPHEGEDPLPILDPHANHRRTNARRHAAFYQGADGGGGSGEGSGGAAPPPLSRKRTRVQRRDDPVDDSLGRASSAASVRTESPTTIADRSTDIAPPHRQRGELPTTAAPAPRSEGATVSASRDCVPPGSAQPSTAGPTAHVMAAASSTGLSSIASTQATAAAATTNTVAAAVITSEDDDSVPPIEPSHGIRQTPPVADISDDSVPPRPPPSTGSCDDDDDDGGSEEEEDDGSSAEGDDGGEASDTTASMASSMDGASTSGTDDDDSHGDDGIAAAVSVLPAELRPPQPLAPPAAFHGVILTKVALRWIAAQEWATNAANVVRNQQLRRIWLREQRHLFRDLRGMSDALQANHLASLVIQASRRPGASLVARLEETRLFRMLVQGAAAVGGGVGPPPERHMDPSAGPPPRDPPGAPT